MRKKIVFLIFLSAFILKLSIADYSSQLYLTTQKAEITAEQNFPKIDVEILRQLNEKDEVPVIILLRNDMQNSVTLAPQYKNLTTLQYSIRKNQEKFLSNLKLNSPNDFKVKYLYKTINSISGSLKGEVIEKLKKDPDIEAIYFDRKLKILLDESVPLINATDVWKIKVNNENITGKGQTVCVIDTGIDYRHQDLGNCTQEQFLNGNCSKVISGYDFVNSDNDPMDDNDHGTHVAGIVAANGLLRGVAPDAKLLALKVCNASGYCSDSDIIAAIDWCNSNYSKYNISVITMSLGDDGQYTSSNCPTYMDSVINVAHSLGIFVSVASGNNGYSNGISYPACSPNVTSVGSTTKGDVISSFTNTGENLDLLAPGQSIFSTVVDYGYQSMSGTSMATPHVAGAAALLRQYKPDITPDEIEYYLKATGKNITDLDNGLNFSRINVLAAIFSLTKLPNITACWLNQTDVEQGAVVRLSSNISKGTYPFSLIWWTLDGSILNLIENTSSTYWTYIDTSSMLGNYTEIFSFVNDTYGNFHNMSCGYLNVNPKYRYNTIINITANVTSVIDAKNETNTTLEILTFENVTNAEITIKYYSYNPTNTVFSALELGKYIEINISQNLQNSLKAIMIKIFYTDEEVNSKGINESSLGFYWYNETTPEWMLLNDTWDWVYGIGVNSYENYIWANVSHLSIYCIGSETEKREFTIQLRDGWNLISIPLNLQI
ncbi:MAG: S8 family serine peptidase [Candidatus Altiarchaeota archaeon]